MKIIIKKMILSNWKGKSITLDFDEEGNIISGRNGEGKTLVGKAWSWLLTGYTDPAYPKNHELFDNTQEITENTPEAGVEISMDMDGVVYKMARTAKAKFVRERQKNVFVKANSDEYSFYIDDVKRSATEFSMFLSRIAPPEMLQYCVSGLFFINKAESDKAQARKDLGNIIGEIKPEDFANDYSELYAELKKFDLIDLRSRLTNQKAPIKQELTTIPVLLEEKEKTLSDLKLINIKAIEDKMTLISARIKEIDDALSTVREAVPVNAKEIADLTKKKAQLKEEFKDKRDKYTEEIFQKKKAIRACKSKEVEAVRLQQSNRNTVKKDLERLLGDIETFEKELESKKEKISQLRTERASLKEKEFTPEECSFCHQALPEAMVEKAKDEFMAKIKSEISRIDTEGLSLKKAINTAESAIEILKEKIAKEQAALPPEGTKFQADPVADIEATYERQINDIPEWENTEEAIALSKEIEDVVIPTPETGERIPEGLVEEKTSLMLEYKEVVQQLTVKGKIADLEEDIKKLKIKRRENANEQARIEKMIDLIDSYEREKADIAAERVNKYLTSCRIQMFQILKSGERKDDCLVTNLDGVKYSTANEASRIKMNIEIQRLFCFKNNLSLPVFVDNCSLIDSDKLPKDGSTQVFLILNNDNPLSVSELY